jgi:hypothetical protein
MGTPSKTGNVSNVVISGSIDFNSTFGSWLTSSPISTPTGTTLIQAPTSILTTAESNISNINAKFSNGVYSNGVTTYTLNDAILKIYGAQGLLNSISATRIELDILNPAPNNLSKIIFTGNFDENFITSNLIGSGDTISSIQVQYATATSGVQSTYTLATTLGYSTFSNLLTGTIDGYTRVNTETTGPYTGWQYVTNFTYDNVKVNGAVVTSTTTGGGFTIGNNASAYFNYIKGYDNNGVIVYSRTTNPAIALPLQTDTGLYADTLYAGNNLFVINGSFANTINTYAGDDYIQDNNTGNITIDSGDGNDEIEFPNAYAKYSIYKTSSTTLVIKFGTTTQQIQNVEILKFSDQTITVANLPISNTNFVTGTSANDVFNVASGNIISNTSTSSKIQASNFIDGVAGFDKIIFNYPSNQFQITYVNGNINLNSTTLGNFVLTNIERITFPEKNIAIDMLPTQSGGQTAEVLNAAFGLSFLTNKQYFGIGLGLFDGGMSFTNVCQLAVGTGLISAPDNASFVKAVWQNVMGFVIDATSLNTYVGLLNNGTYTQASLLAIAATTSINQNHVNLIGLAQTGVEYTPTS